MKRILTHALAALALPVLMAAPAQSEDRAIVVLDASGSMWGQIEGKSKIEIARETLTGVLEEVPNDLELGLIAYGHRRKGDCRDIETLVPPGTGQVTGIVAAANRIKPKGKTPLSAAVREAARALRYTEAKATVILVTDGLETCNADPCALANELEQAGVDFTAHVVGFGLSKDEGKQVACLAENTGGKYIEASNGQELTDALKQTVVAPPEPAPQPAPPPPPPAAAVPDPLHIRIFTGPDKSKQDTIGESGHDNIELKIVRADAPADAESLPFGPGRPIPGTEHSSTVTATLDAGDYLASIAYPAQGFSSQVPFTVSPGMANPLDLYSGIVRMEPKFVAHQGGPAFDPHVRYIPVVDGTPDESKAIVDQHAMLRSGTWILEAKQWRTGLWEPKKTFTLQGGEHITETIDLKFASVTITVEDVGGGPVESPAFEICRQDQPKSCSATYDGVTDAFHIGEGRYTVKGGHYYSGEKWGTIDIDVKAGQSHSFTVRQVEEKKP